MGALSFYTMMGYATPIRSEFFAYQQSDLQASRRPLQAFRSRIEQPSETMKSYLALITKWQWIRKYIPGVESVFLANSITFNALREDSNIDFFIVTGEKRLRTTKFFVDFVFLCINIWEGHRTKTMSFSADFFVTAKMQDLSRILLSPSDPYLVYWLAHLVPIYHSDFVLYDTIYEENSWLQYYLPNFLSRQTIFLGIDVLIGTSGIKRRSNRFLYSLAGKIAELGAKYFLLLLCRWKKKRAPALAMYILIGSGLYKSYDDKRKWYALQRELGKKADKQDKKEH